MKIDRLCAAVALTVAASFPAHADSNWIGVHALTGAQTPGWFITPGAEIGVLNLPRWNSTNTLHFPVGFGAPQVSVISSEPTLFGGAYGATVGYGLQDGTLPPWLGQRVRVGLTGSYLSYSDRSETRIPSVGNFAAGIIDLQGRTVHAFVTGGGFIDSLRVHRRGFDLNLRAASDFPLTPTLTFTPSVAVFGGRTVDTYNYFSAFPSSTGINFFSTSIDEKVRTTTIGGDFSAGFTWQATPFLALNFTGRGGVAWMRSNLEGTSCIEFNPGFCQLGAFVPGTSSNSTASDSRSRIGFRGGAALNASLDMRFGILTLGGFFMYDSAVPGVQNPAQTTLLAVGVSTGQAAHIRFDDAFRYGAVVTLRVPLLFM